MDAIVRGRLAVALAVAVLAAALAPATALALDAPAVAVQSVSLDSTTVAFRATYGTGTSSVVLLVNGDERDRVVVAPASGGAVTLSAAVADGDTIRARADASASEQVEGNALTFANAPYLPKPTELLYANNHVVSQYSAVPVRVSVGMRTLRYRIRGGEWLEVPAAPNSAGWMRIPVTRMSYGGNAVEVAAKNAWGTSPSRVRLVRYLGSIPSTSRFVLVDKSELELYYVDHSCLVRSYPIAIGMWGTPTPTGRFVLGSPRRAPNSVWGPFRMPLMTGRRGRYRIGSYYIHGTNDPDSIGTMASHGCVRMYNSNLRDLARRLQRRATVTSIRR